MENNTGKDKRQKTKAKRSFQWQEAAFLALFLLISLGFARQAQAARLFTSGFEMNSNTDGVEFDVNVGSPTIQGTTKRSGSYALQELGGAGTKYVAYHSPTLVSGGICYLRVYLLIHASVSGVKITS